MHIKCSAFLIKSSSRLIFPNSDRTYTEETLFILISRRIYIKLFSDISMIMSVTMASGGKVAGPQECAGCNKKIHDKFILKVRKIFFCKMFKDFLTNFTSGNAVSIEWLLDSGIINYPLPCHY